MEEPTFRSSSANKTAGTAFVVRVVLKYGASLLPVYTENSLDSNPLSGFMQGAANGCV
jgi:hypothetical protein